MSVLSRARLDQRGVHGLELEPWLIGIWCEIRLGRLEEVHVIALGELWFVVCASGFIAQGRSLSNHPRELQHVVELTREDE